jgi:hypothetical protein
VPEALRPPQEELDPDNAPDDWGSLSDDEREAWLAGRKPTRKKAADAASVDASADAADDADVADVADAS